MKHEKALSKVSPVFSTPGEIEIRSSFLHWHIAPRNIRVCFPFQVSVLRVNVQNVTRESRVNWSPVGLDSGLVLSTQVQSGLIKGSRITTPLVSQWEILSWITMWDYHVTHRMTMANFGEALFLDSLKKPVAERTQQVCSSVLCSFCNVVTMCDQNVSLFLGRRLLPSFHQ